MVQKIVLLLHGSLLPIVSNKIQLQLNLVLFVKKTITNSIMGVVKKENFTIQHLKHVRTYQFSIVSKLMEQQLLLV